MFINTDKMAYHAPIQVNADIERFHVYNDENYLYGRLDHEIFRTSYGPTQHEGVWLEMLSDDQAEIEQAIKDGCAYQIIDGQKYGFW